LEECARCGVGAAGTLRDRVEGTTILMVSGNETASTGRGVAVRIMIA
jgi:hypothetical protein